MIAFKRILGLNVGRWGNIRSFYYFGDAWKDRDEAAEKVYITRQEKQTIKRLLSKVQEEQADLQSNMQQFDRKLKDIMQRYKIKNQVLASQISNLHKKFTH